MAKRQTPNRRAAFGRGFLAGAMLVGAYGALYLVQSNNLPPEPPDKWGQWIRDYVMPILPVAIVTILIATFGGVLIECPFHHCAHPHTTCRDGWWSSSWG